MSKLKDLKPTERSHRVLHEEMTEVLEDAACRLANDNRVELAWELRGLIERLNGLPLTRDACDDAGEYEHDFIVGWTKSEDFCGACEGSPSLADQKLALVGKEIVCLRCFEQDLVHEEHHPDWQS